MIKRLIYLTIPVALAVFSSCKHKELCYDPHDGLIRTEMNIVIHWQDGVTKPAKGMMVNLFGVGATPHYGMEHFPADGGPVSLVTDGTYHGTCYDYYAENIYFRNEYDYQALEAYCAPLTRATYSRAFPDDVTVAEPDFPFWVDRVQDFPVTGEDMHYYPDNVVEVFTFEIRNVEGAQYISACRGGIGGMSASYGIFEGTLAQVASTVLFDAAKDGANKKITGSFRTFGRVNASAVTNNFTIEILYPSKNGGIIHATWDVTDQVVAALHIPGIPDIIIDNDGRIPPIIPDDDDKGSGFEADVERWEDITVPMPM